MMTTKRWIATAVLVCSLSTPALAAARAHVTPVSEANRFAAALRSAATPSALQVVIVELLDTLGVPIYNAAGRQIGRHQSSTPDQFRVYETEVSLISQAFLRGELTPLDIIATDLASTGFTCGGTGPCDGAALENLLRQTRRYAAAAPDDWQGLVILLIDALGKREERPCNLVGPTDNSCRSGANVAASPAADRAAMLAELFANMAKQAEAEGDAETAAMFRAMQSAGNLDQIMDGLARGDTSMFLQAVGMNDELPEPDLYSEAVYATGFASATEANQVTRELAQMEVDRRRQEQAEYVRDSSYANELGAEPQIDVAQREVTLALEVEQAVTNYQFAEWHADVLDHMWKDPPEDESWKFELRGVSDGSTDELSSCVYLDPVQVLLLYIELLDMARPIHAGGGM